jgi:shikimate 5-dehydrogenase
VRQETNGLAWFLVIMILANAQTDADDCHAQVFGSEAFGGCSVTIPHKISVMQHVDDLTDAARTIGAVNTVWRTAEGRVAGDNTGV